jgi:hypothetical protein
MNYSSSDSMMSKLYAPLWNKYRPAILQLMVASATGPQQYKLSGHEFKGLNPKEKRGHSFKLQAHKGKATNNIKELPVAQDLLFVLASSKKASDLMSTDSYEFTLDKQFVLHITKVEAVVVAE